MPQTTLLGVREEWTVAWESAGFRRKILSGLLLAVAILSAFPIFFQTIEKRSGVLLNDPILRWLPAHNVSLAIFIVIWSVSLLMIIRAVRTPAIFLTFLWSYIFCLILRVITITIVPLDPPAGLVGLVDPISNFFYGEKFVTRDLFFSGHTSAVFLMFLCLPGRRDKFLAGIGTGIVAFLLLVQHVHYTLDVLGALVFAAIARWIAIRTIAREPF